ncbi:MAG: hypothetical protein PVH19_14500, partial [Planctomycetia bacterium]
MEDSPHTSLQTDTIASLPLPPSEERPIGQKAEQFNAAQTSVPMISLRERLDRGPLDLQDTLILAKCLFSELCKVHAQGELYHNIRPANITVTDEPYLTSAVFSNTGLEYD